MPKPISIEQINAMSKEEVQALNAKLGRQIVVNIGTKVLLKTAVIFGSAFMAKKFLEYTRPIQAEKSNGGD